MGSTSAPPLDSKRILCARIAKRLTQSEVSALCAERNLKIARAQISMIETGSTQRPSFQIITVLAEVLGIPEDEMFADDDTGTAKAA